MVIKQSEERKRVIMLKEIKLDVKLDEGEKQNQWRLYTLFFLFPSLVSLSCKQMKTFYVDYISFFSSSFPLFRYFPATSQLPSHSLSPTFPPRHAHNSPSQGKQNRKQSQLSMHTLCSLMMVISACSVSSSLSHVPPSRILLPVSVTRETLRKSRSSSMSFARCVFFLCFLPSILLQCSSLAVFFS